MHQSISFLLGAVMMLTTATTALAADTPDDACQRVMVSMPDNLIKLLDRLDKLVISVPPDENKYLDEESAAATMPHSDARMEAVMKRPFFYPRQFHTDVDWGRNIIGMLTFPDAPKKKVQMASFVPYHIMMIKDSFVEVIAHDYSHTIGSSDADWGERQLIQEMYEAQQYISCWAERI